MPTMNDPWVDTLANGSPMGCSDSALPEKYTEEQLSRTRDAIRMLKIVCGKEDFQCVFAALPHDLKMEMIWSKWNYVSPRAG